MLSEQDKERIKAEEIFRSEVKQQIGGKPSVSSRIWKGLNSPVILLLFSSLVFKLISDRYTEKQNILREQSKNREVQQNIYMEICNRISQALSYVDMLDKQNKDSVRLWPKWCYHYTTQYLNNHFTDDAYKALDFSVRPEYQKRTFNSLLIELNSYSDTSEHMHITNGINCFNELYKHSLNQRDTLTATAGTALAIIRSIIADKILRSLQMCPSFPKDQIVLAVLPEASKLYPAPLEVQKALKRASKQ